MWPPSDSAGERSVMRDSVRGSESGGWPGAVAEGIPPGPDSARASGTWDWGTAGVVGGIRSTTVTRSGVEQHSWDSSPDRSCGESAAGPSGASRTRVRDTRGYSRAVLERSNCVRMVRRIRRMWRGSRHPVAPRLGIDFVVPEVAVVTTRWDTYEGDEPGELTKVQTDVIARGEDGAWQVASFHNTQRSSVLERVQVLMSPGAAPAAER